MPKGIGYKNPTGIRGTAAAKKPSSLTGEPSTGIGSNNQGSASGKTPDSLSGLPSGSIGGDNRGPQPAAKVMRY